MFLTPTHSDDVCCDLQPLGQCKKYWPGNHQLSRLICKVMNIHTWQPGMKHDQGYHFPQFMEQFCSLIKIKLRIIGIWIGSKSSESLVLKNIFFCQRKIFFMEMIHSNLTLVKYYTNMISYHYIFLPRVHVYALFQ